MFKPICKMIVHKLHLKLRKQDENLKVYLWDDIVKVALNVTNSDKKSYLWDLITQLMILPSTNQS